MSKTTPSLRHLSVVLAASAGLAVPAVAFASHGADDPAGTTTGTTTSTTTTTTTDTPGTTPTPAPATSGRARAIAAAKARVGGTTTVVRVKRRGNGWEVRLTSTTTRFTVRMTQGFRVTRVKQEPLRATTPGDDDGTPDQGRGDN